MKIRVLHLRSSAGFFGAERVIVTLLPRLNDQGVQPVLGCIQNYITGDSSLLEAARHGGIEVTEMRCRSRLDWRTFLDIIDLCQSKDIHIIHTHDYKSHVYGVFGGLYCRIPRVATLHGWPSNQGIEWLYRLIERVMLQAIDRVIVVSRTLQEALGNSPKISVVHNGVDEMLFHPGGQGLGRERWGLDDEHFVFGVVARMTPEKGHQVLLEAFAEVIAKEPTARLLLVGDGPEKKGLVQYAEEKGLGHFIRFCGTQTEIERLLRDINCYVSPSDTEGMPMSILEAMATGLPIVATEVGEIGNMLRDGAGCLVRPGAPGELASKMLFVMQQRTWTKRMGGLARARVVNEYGVARQATVYARIYRELLNIRGSDLRPKFRKVIKKGLVGALMYSGITPWLSHQPSVVILMLHKIGDKPDPLPLTLSPSLFEAAILEIKRQHQFASLDELVHDGRLNHSDGPQFALTFDDGYRDNYEFAYPILKRHGVPATIFLSLHHVDGACAFWFEHLMDILLRAPIGTLDLSDTELGVLPLNTPGDRKHAIVMLNQWLKGFDEKQRQDWIGRLANQLQIDNPEGLSLMLTWDMVREMAEYGIRFGSHTLSHPILSRESPERIREEVCESKRILEERLGMPVHGFSYPNGSAADFNEEVIAEVRKAGYRYACTTVPGRNKPDVDTYKLRRINLHNEMCSDGKGRFDRKLFWAKVLGVI